MSDSIHIYTFKRGLLSRVAHDLRLSLTRWELRWDGPGFELELDPRSLRVDGVMKRGLLRAGALSAKDCRDVLNNTHEQVLRTDRHPLIRYRGEAAPRGSEVRVSGQLDLVGRSLPVPFSLALRGRRAVGRVEITPSRWGIEPFTALMGTIALEDRVVLAFDLGLPPELA
jgi:hypothetical protein